MPAKSPPPSSEAKQTLSVRCRCGTQISIALPLVLAEGSPELERVVEEEALGEVTCRECGRPTRIDAPFGVTGGPDGEAALLLPESSRWRELPELIEFLQRLAVAQVGYPTALLRPRLCFGWSELAEFRAASGELGAAAAAAPPESTASEASKEPLPPLSPTSAPLPQPPRSPSSPALGAIPSPSLLPQPGPRPPSSPGMAAVPAPSLLPKPPPSSSAPQLAGEDEDEPRTAIHRSAPVPPANAETRFAQTTQTAALYLDGSEVVACGLAAMPTADPLEARLELCNLPTYSIVLVTLGYAPLRPGTLGLFRVPLDPDDGRTRPLVEALEAFGSVRCSFFDDRRRLTYSAAATVRPGSRPTELLVRAIEANQRLPHGGRSFERAVEVLALAVGQKGAAVGALAAAVTTPPSSRVTAQLGAVPAPKSQSFRRLSREELPSASSEHLVKMLDDSELRVDAALLLCERREVGTLPGLCQALGRMPRLEASRVLPAMTGFGPSSEPYLVEILGAKKAFLRQGAALALGQLRTARGTEALCQALLDEPTEIWSELARALGDAGAQAVMPLGNRLRSASTEQRDRIVRALAHIAAGGVRGPVEMLGTSRDPAIADAARRALSLVPEVQRLDKEVRGGTSEHTVVRGFSHRFYEGLDGEVELSPDEVEIAEDSGARRAPRPDAGGAAAAGKRPTTARSLGAIDDLFDRAERAERPVTPGFEERRTDPSRPVVHPDADGDPPPEPPRSRRGTLPRGVS